MNFDEIKILLALAAARDNRKPSQPMTLAWLEDLGDLDFTVAREALGRHFRTSTDYLMPVHIRQIAQDIHREQRRAVREDRDERLAIEAAAVPRGELRFASPAVQAFMAAAAEKFALEPSEAIRQRAIKRAREERGRPEKPPRAKPAKTRKGDPNLDPQSPEIGALARSYLAEGYEPKDVGNRLGIARKWCEKAARAIGAQEAA